MRPWHCIHWNIRGAFISCNREKRAHDRTLEFVRTPAQNIWCFIVLAANNLIILLANVNKYVSCMVHESGGQWVPREWPVAPEMLAIANEGMAAATAMPIDSSGEEQ